jgi:glutaredoxin 2
MIFGLKNIPVELNVLLNDDEATPTRMIGQKMAPILQKDDSRYLPESMDIVHYVDKLDGKPLLTGKQNPALDAWLKSQWLRQSSAHSAFCQKPLRRVRYA